MVNINNLINLIFLKQQEKKVEVEAEDDPELARYLDRAYWEGLKVGNTTKTVQPKMTSTINVYFLWCFIYNLLMILSFL